MSFIEASTVENRGKLSLRLRPGGLQPTPRSNKSDHATLELPPAHSVYIHLTKMLRHYISQRLAPKYHWQNSTLFAGQCSQTVTH